MAALLNNSTLRGGQLVMNTKAENNPRQARMARRTAWILGTIAVAIFVLSIVQQLVLVHQG
jgi:hypothetical protein